MKIPKMTFYINSNCNLNCKGCAHFAPLAKPWKIKLEDFENEANLIHNLCEPKQISILGGEPLLHDELDKILKYARKIFIKQKISFVTNGVLLNKHFDKDLFKCIKENNINIRFSVYPIDVNYNLIFKKLDLLKISYDMENDFVNNKNEPWFHYHYHNKKNKTARYCYIRDALDSPQVYNYKIFGCATTAYICHFNQYFNENFELKEDDYLDLKTCSIDEFNKFIHNLHKNGTSFCHNYCSYDIDDKWKWGLTERNKKEWT